MKKAVITNMDTNEEIEVMFNPKEYVVEKKTPWSEINVFGLDSPPPLCSLQWARENGFPWNCFSIPLRKWQMSVNTHQKLKS